MDSDRGLQEVVSRNVRVLMAVHGITHQKDLAAQLQWGSDKLTRTLNGSRRWALEDLPAIAEIFGVRPAALLSDTAELVGAAQPARVSDASSQGVSARYQPTNAGTVIPFPLGRVARPRYLPHPAHVTRTGDIPHSGQSAVLNGTSADVVTIVTAQVGS